MSDLEHEVLWEPVKPGDHVKLVLDRHPRPGQHPRAFFSWTITALTSSICPRYILSCIFLSRIDACISVLGVWIVDSVKLWLYNVSVDRGPGDILGSETLKLKLKSWLEPKRCFLGDVYLPQRSRFRASKLLIESTFVRLAIEEMSSVPILLCPVGVIEMQ